MSVLDEVGEERIRQERRWGAKHDVLHSWWDWKGFMLLRLRKVEPHQSLKVRRRALIELAALAIAAVEANE